MLLCLKGISERDRSKMVTCMIWSIPDGRREQRSERSQSCGRYDSLTGGQQ